VLWIPHADISRQDIARFVAKERIADETLRDAIRRAEAGQIDADLGGGVIQQRVARSGGGKSGGYRTIVFYRRGTRAVFAYGFAKNDRDNIDPNELRDFRDAARTILALTEADMNKAVTNGAFREITEDE
jgi:hypothetical protein